MACVGQMSMQARQLPQCSLAGRIDRQRQVGVELAEEEPGAGVARQQVGVLADPAQAGLLRQRLFQHRSAVDEGAVAERPDLCLDAVGELLQAPAQHLVIVATQRIARDVAGGRDVEHGFRIGAFRRHIVHAYGDDSPGTGHQFRGTAALAAVAGHVVHLAVQAVGQPVVQARFRFIQFRISDAAGGEAEFVRPVFYLLGQCGGVVRGEGHGWGCADSVVWMTDVSIITGCV